MAARFIPLRMTIPWILFAVLSAKCLHLDSNYSLPDEYIHDDTSRTEHRNLCVTFLSTPNQEKKSDISRDTLLINIQYLDCDWLILFYRVDAVLQKQKLCADAEAATIRFHHQNRIICCDEASFVRNSSAYLANHIKNLTMLDVLGYRQYEQVRVVKPIMYIDVLYYLHFIRSYRRVFMMDSDIDFQKYDFKKGLLLWKNISTPPPLVVQPVMDGRTKIASSRWNFWKNQKSTERSNHIYPFIEQGHPFFDARYFRWFVITIIRDNTLPYHMAYQSDYGYDCIWCHAAYYFGTEVLNYIDYTTPCAVLIAAGYTIHRDTKTLKKSNIFRALSGEVVKYYRQCYPHWFRPF